MKCTRCNAEIPENAEFCPKCQAPVNSNTQGTSQGGGTSATVPDSRGDSGAAGSENGGWKAPSGTSVQPEASTSQGAAGGNVPKPMSSKKPVIILSAVIAAVVIVCAAVLVTVMMTKKDPKEVVIEAFQSVYAEGQVDPMEELFGLKEFAENGKTADSEGGATLQLDSCSLPEVDAFAGSGLRIEGRNDLTNSRSDFNLGVIYNGMDLANLDMYYGDDTLMMAVPELSTRVFVLDLGEGLADRIKASPTVGPLLEESGVDVDGLCTFFTEMIDESEQAVKEGTEPFDLKALYERYKAGCQAQDEFKAAMTVETSDKKTFTVDGKEVSCKGYDVTISKESMIEFLRTSSDFFLQDETLKEDFLRQLETTVRMSELMGTAMTGMDTLSVEEMQEQTYEEIEKAVDEMITYLDESLNDVQMKVYVDKKGRLAAVEGTTVLDVTYSYTGETDEIQVDFDFQLMGGAYLTQNVTGNIELSDSTDTVSLALTKEGTYDGKKLTSGLSLDLTLMGETYTLLYDSSYDSADGSYHLGLDLGGSYTKAVELSMDGVVDQLEKGKSFHMDVDALEIGILDNTTNIVFSGEYYYQPLSGEITPLEGEEMDMLAASEEEWQSVMMEVVFSAMGLAGQLDVPMY